MIWIVSISTINFVHTVSFVIDLTSFVIFLNRSNAIGTSSSDHTDIFHMAHSVSNFFLVGCYLVKAIFVSAFHKISLQLKKEYLLH